MIIKRHNCNSISHKRFIVHREPRSSTSSRLVTVLIDEEKEKILLPRKMKS